MIRCWSLLVLFCLLSQHLDAKGGGSGGGRGFSGARSSSSSNGGFRSSGSSFSSSRTNTGRTSSYRSGNAQYNSNFRQNVFHTTSYSSTFMVSPITHTNVIISPITPIVFGSYHYYWGGHYVHSEQQPHKCEYQITDDDEELRNVTFSNGTKPTTLTFGCKSSESCCGLECCTNSATWVVILVIIIGCLVLVLACLWGSKHGYCQSDSVVSTAVPVITATTTTYTYTTQPGPFPPSGFQGFQQSGPPPTAPVFASPPAYDNYEQNSPYGGRPLSSGQIHTTYKQ